MDYIHGTDLLGSQIIGLIPVIVIGLGLLSNWTAYSLVIFYCAVGVQGKSVIHIQF